ncbi:hypothetical protein CKAH01_10910 [Colletotrichum kahawae]|uniref:Uncharacterized protein n=1 Tax=Colletotrichum kahawae TaxID=34407 RepID=A0AAD9XVY9_COLKA|nr:hypothetical protein CKAH01_10910 [Colletotrichum kahawae]
MCRRQPPRKRNPARIEPQAPPGILKLAAPPSAGVPPACRSIVLRMPPQFFPATTKSADDRAATPPAASGACVRTLLS